MPPSTTSPVPARACDRRAQVVADEGAVLDLAEEVDDQHVALAASVSMTQVF